VFHLFLFSVDIVRQRENGLLLFSLFKILKLKILTRQFSPGALVYEYIINIKCITITHFYELTCIGYTKKFVPAVEDTSFITVWKNLSLLNY